MNTSLLFIIIINKKYEGVVQRMSKLKVKDIRAEVEGKEILKGVNLEINQGEVHVIMGPNGTGKSTLSSVIMGHPKYEVTSGEITLDGEDVLEMEVDERAKAGLFLAMQYPSEISGITNSDFLRTAISNVSDEQESLVKYIRRLEGSISDLKMDKDMINRYLNENFSGGEKKKNEILQLKMLDPKIAILDEIDSGLDIDALSIVGNNLTKQMEENKDHLGMLLITHYERILNYIKPTHVHVMLDGRIVETGGPELVDILESEGYDKFKEKYGIQDNLIEERTVEFVNGASKIGENSEN